MNILFCNKFGKIQKLDDEKFINTCIKAKNKYINPNPVKQGSQKYPSIDSDSPSQEQTTNTANPSKPIKKIIRSKRIL